VQLDGELVALDADGRPDFHRLGARMLHGRPGIAVTQFVFDVLAVEGLPVTASPYRERRVLLEELAVEGPRVRLVATFEARLSPAGQATMWQLVVPTTIVGYSLKRPAPNVRRSPAGPAAAAAGLRS
jgi:hypothetical protein